MSVHQNSVQILVPHSKVWPQYFKNVMFSVSGEAFIQPNVIPPFHRYYLNKLIGFRVLSVNGYILVLKVSMQQAKYKSRVRIMCVCHSFKLIFLIY
jgi:hypothetical protein